MSDSVQSHRQQPTRLPRPWDSPGKNIGVGYHCLLLSGYTAIQTPSSVKIINPPTLYLESPPTFSPGKFTSAPSQEAKHPPFLSANSSIHISPEFPMASQKFSHDPPCCCCLVTSVVSDSVRPHRRQPTRLRRPWNSPGKNTGVGCHFPLQCMKVKSEVAQSCSTLRDPMDGSPPGSSIHGIFQARVLDWGAIAFSDIYIYIYIYI